MLNDTTPDPSTTHQTPIMPFNILALPTELRLEILSHVLTAQLYSEPYTPNIRRLIWTHMPLSFDPQILRVNKQLHAEGQPLLHSLNAIEVDIRSYLMPWHLRRRRADLGDGDMAHSSVTLRLSGRHLWQRLYDDDESANVLLTASEWPVFLRKARQIKLKIRLTVDPRYVEPAGGVFQPDPATLLPFVGVSHLIASLAGASPGCGALDLDVGCSANMAGFDIGRVFDSVAGFSKVRTCTAKWEGQALAGGRLRAAVLTSAPVESTKLLGRIIEIKEEVALVVHLANSTRDVLSRLGGTNNAVWRSKLAIARRLLRKLENRDIAAIGYLPFGFGGAPVVEAILSTMEEFLGMEQTQLLRRISAVVEGDYTDEEMDGVVPLLPEIHF